MQASDRARALEDRLTRTTTRLDNKFSSLVKPLKVLSRVVVDVKALHTRLDITRGGLARASNISLPPPAPPAVGSLVAAASGEGELTGYVDCRPRLVGVCSCPLLRLHPVEGALLRACACLARTTCCPGVRRAPTDLFTCTPGACPGRRP